MHELIELKLETYSDAPVDFSAFPKLTNCWFEWIKDSDSLFECKSLKRLGLNNFAPFSNFVNLERLTLLNSAIEDMNGIVKLAMLTYLSMANLGKVTSLSGIKALQNLEILEIEKCKGIGSVSEIFF